MQGNHTGRNRYDGALQTGWAQRDAQEHVRWDGGDAGRMRIWVRFMHFARALLPRKETPSGMYTTFTFALKKASGSIWTKSAGRVPDGADISIRG